MFNQDIIVNAGGNTKFSRIDGIAKRKANKLFARCKNPIEYLGIDHDRTETIKENPMRCKFYCVFVVKMLGQKTQND